MADIQSNINLDIDASGALATLRTLQRQISAFQQTMAKTGAMSNARLGDMQQNLVNSINSTGQFTASIQKVRTTTESFTNALEKNKLSMGQYFRYSMGATKTFGRGFKTEFDTIEKVARERVKTLQTQYIKLGRDGQGAMQAIAVRPQVLDMKDLGTQTAIAAQKAQLFNQLMSQGSTNLLNFGKNTQWAGRQLMVGFTIPLGIMGAAAAKEFKAIEEQVIRLERVYGDFTTTMADTEQMTSQIKDLANEFTKYGVAVSKTIGLAADAAAMGSVGADLVAQVAEANRLAVLGGVQQEQALETTISLTSAFGVAREELANKTDFLNAVENQTITSIEDLTTAIPKAGPVVQQLGGNVEDLTFFLTAMREGGINASESANALKSGLASLINPTAEASEMLGGFGINLQGIVEANKGNVKGIVIDFAKALDTLDPLNRAQAIEQLFGKFQFSRLSTLFQNVIKEGGQASRVLELTQTSAAELAALSERELGKVEASPLFQFEGAIERFKAALAPVGEEFMKAVTPLINFGTQILEGFNNMEGGVKQFSVIAVGAIGAIGPVLLMTIGLLMNGLANIVKGVLFVRNGFKGMGDQSNILTQQLNYMNTEQLEAAAVSASLNQVHNTLIQTFTAEAGAVRNLAGAYGQAIAAQGAFMGPITTRGGGMKSPKKFAAGGFVPGSGNGDTVPALLTPGEFVLRKDVAAAYPGVIAGMMSGTLQKFAMGGPVRAHLTAPFSTSSKQYKGAVNDYGLQGLAASFPGSVKVVSNLVAELSQSLNIALEKGTASIEQFTKDWSSRTGKLNLSAKLGGADISDAKNLKALEQLENSIGERAVQLAKGTKDQKVSDALLTRATKEVIAEYKTKGGAAASVAKSLDTASKQVGQVRKQLSTEQIKTGLSSGAMTQDKLGRVYHDGVQVARVSQSSGKARPADPLKGKGSYANAKLQSQETILDIQTTNAKKRRANAEVKKATLAENDLRSQTRSDAARRGWETRRLNAEKTIAMQTEQEASMGRAGGGRFGRLRGMMSPGRLGMAGMVAGGALSAASMMGGPVGDAAGQIGGPLMAISGIASVLSMIPGPAGIAVAAIGAVGTGLFLLNEQAKQQQKEQRKLQESMSSSSKVMSVFAESVGGINPSDVANRRRLSGTIPQSEPTFGESFLSQEAGEKLLSDVRNIIDKEGMDAAMESLGNQFGTAIAAGIMSKEQVESISKALGDAMGNQVFSLNVIANVKDIVGKDGKTVQEMSAKQIAAISSADQKEILESLKIAASQPTTDYQASSIEASKIDIVSNFLAVDSQNQLLLDALDEQYLATIEQLKSEGKIEEAKQKQLEYEEKRTGLLAATNKFNEEFLTYVRGLGDRARDKLVSETAVQTKEVFAGTEQESTANELVGQLETSRVEAGAKMLIMADVQSGTMTLDQLQMVFDLFDPNNPDEARQINLMADIGAQMGPGMTADIVNLLPSFNGNDVAAGEFLAIFEEEGAEEFQNTVEIFEAMQAANPEIDFSIFFDGSEESEAKLQKLQDAYKKVDDYITEHGDISAQAVLEQEIITDEYGMKMMQENQAWFDSLPASMKKAFLTQYLAVFETVTPAQAKQALAEAGIAMEGSRTVSRRGSRGSAGKVTVSQYSAEQLRQGASLYAQGQAREMMEGLASTGPSGPGPANPPPGGGGGGGSQEPEKPPTSFLDSLVKDIRDFTRSAQGLTENFVDSMNAIRSATVSAFEGLSQQLRGVGLGEDVISMMTGMSKEDWDQYKGQFFNFDAAGNVTGFKNDLAVIQERLRGVTLGKFVDEQQKSIANASSQALGLSKLVSLGMSYANAYEMVEDAALAAAIANASSAEEIRKIIELANQARQIQSLADASKSVAGTNDATDATLAGLNALIKYNSALSDTQISAILASDELQTMLANFDTLDVSQLEVLNEALQDAANKEALEIQIKMQTPEGMQDLFNEGFGKAMEQFSAREQEIKIKFTALKDPFQHVIKSFSEQIEDMKEAPGGLDDLEADLQRIGEQEIDINKKYDERFKALDSIAKVNERIAAQQRTQLSLSEALSMGDIAAAARVAQEIRANDAAQALVDQREALQKSQELELENLMGNMGMTRAQLEAQIRDIKQQIFEIEEAQIEPAQYQLDLLTRREEGEIRSLTVLGQTRDQWEETKNQIEIAKTSTEAYELAIGRAQGLVQQIIDKWGEVPSQVTTIHTIIEDRITAIQNTPPPPTPAPAPAPVASTAPAPTGPVKNQAWIDSMATAVIRGDYGNGQERRNKLGSDYQMIQDRVNQHYYGGARLFNKGGYVASYMANGGMTKPLFGKKGTDTVPAMLTPGEFVIKKWAVDKFGVGNLNAINQGNFGSGSVYNYNMSVNVRSDANPDEIARTVMAQIKRVDAQRIRGNRF
jgi:TP901 family phage tail tape measure protein